MAEETFNFENLPSSINNTNIAVIGPQGAGKSTLCGHLLQICGGSISKSSISNSRKQATKKGRPDL
jgi:translation elongation factor EF-1alpha